MFDFEKDMTQTETPLGFMSGEVIRMWVKAVPDIADRYNKLLTEVRPCRGTPPAGYIRRKGEAHPVASQQHALIVAVSKYCFEKRFSLQESVDLLAVAGISLSRQGFVKASQRILDYFGVADLVPKRGAVVVETLQDAERVVRQKRQQAAKKVLKGEATLEEAVGKPAESPPQESPKPEPTVEEPQDDEFSGREVIYEPTPKQALFHAASEKIVLYGGAAGGGKSFALLFDVLSFAHVPRYRAVIIRRTMPELTELIETSKEFYPKLFPGAKYNTQKNFWRFPSGAIVEFGYLEHPADKLRYQGQQYQYIAFDELGQWPDAEGWNYLKSRLRKPPIDPYTGKPIPTQMRATSNPGARWVKEMFIDAAEPGTTFYDRAGVSHKFIPATLLDNPHLDQDYRLMLESLPELERRQLLYGDWNATNTSAFPEFRPEIHVVEPFDIPLWWNRVCGMDYGYKDPATAVWYAINPETGQKIVYREYAMSGRTGIEYAKDIKELEESEVIPIDHVIDWQIFAKTGYTGPTIGEQIRMAGICIRQADKNRVSGNVQIHEHLRIDPKTDQPGIVFFSTCPGIINQLQSAQIDEKNPDDIDQKRVGEDSKHHWDLYDSLRYGLMARPTLVNRAVQFQQVKQVSRWNQVSTYFE
ncbi:terminase large subunit [Aeromonas phage 1233]|nr:terminase large subunit [Aeromonas phage 1233]